MSLRKLRTTLSTIQNRGAASLSLFGSPRVVITGAHAHDFTVTDLPITSVSPRKSTTFSVRFHPSAVGLRWATIFIVNDDNNENPYTFDICGTGTAQNATTLYVPHLANNDIWQTTINFVNPNESALDCSVTYFSHNGALLYSSVIPLAPKALWAVQPHHEATVAVIEAPAPLTGFVTFAHRNGGRDTMPAFHGSARELIIPHLAQGPSWWSGLAVSNSEQAGGTVTITFDNGLSHSFSLAGNGHYAFSLESLGPAYGAARSAKVVSDRNIIGLTICGLRSEGTGGLTNDIIVARMNERPSTSLIIPDSAGLEDGWAGIGLLNCEADFDLDLVCEQYGSDGSQSVFSFGDLPPLSHRSFTLWAVGMTEGGLRLTGEYEHSVLGLQNCLIAGLAVLGDDRRVGGYTLSNNLFTGRIGFHNTSRRYDCSREPARFRYDRGLWAIQYEWRYFWARCFDGTGRRKRRPYCCRPVPKRRSTDAGPSASRCRSQYLWSCHERRQCFGEHCSYCSITMTNKRDS